MGTPSFTLLYEIIIGKNKSESILGVSRKIKKKKRQKKKKGKKLKQIEGMKNELLEQKSIKFKIQLTKIYEIKGSSH